MTQQYPEIPVSPGTATAPESTMIPSWANLESGFAGQTPVFDFVGTFDSWSLDSSGSFGARVVCNFRDCVALQADEPVNNTAPISISIKISKSENSAWGKFGKSTAEKLGASLESFDINTLKNLKMHLYRLRENYGKNQATGQNMVGDVWRVYEIIAANAAHSVIPAAVFANQPAKESPVVVAAPVQQPAQVTPLPGVVNSDPNARAIELLDNKDEAGFFAAALSDNDIKTNGALVSSIVTRGFQQGLLANGTFTIDAQGVYHKV